MKSIFLPLVTFLLLHVFIVQASSQVQNLIRRELNKKFPGWKFVEIHKAIHKRLREQVSKDALPYLIQGDFDGNGQLDFAVYITQGRSSERKDMIVALLKKEELFQVHIINSMVSNSEQYPSEHYLMVAKKGSEDLDYETHKKFKYARDSIMEIIDGRASISYVYEKGKFRQVITGD
jgi:hypothetical protein